jgi:hypothetical protein
LLVPTDGELDGVHSCFELDGAGLGQLDLRWPPPRTSARWWPDGFERDALEVEARVFDGSRRRPVQRLYLLKRQLRELLVVIDALQGPLRRVAAPRNDTADGDGLRAPVPLLPPPRLALRSRWPPAGVEFAWSLPG